MFFRKEVPRRYRHAHYNNTFITPAVEMAMNSPEISCQNALNSFLTLCVCEPKLRLIYIQAEIENECWGVFRNYGEINRKEL